MPATKQLKKALALALLAVFPASQAISQEETNPIIIEGPITIQYALVHVHHTRRAASHSHRVTVSYHPTLGLCNEAIPGYSDGRPAPGAVCIPTIAPPN